MVQCDLRCSRSKLRVTNAHGLLVYFTGEKNGMVSLMISNMIMMKKEQTVKMMLMVMYRVPLVAAVMLTTSD